MSVQGEASSMEHGFSGLGKGMFLTQQKTYQHV